VTNRCKHSGPCLRQYAYAARDHVLFCIDASRSMQTPRPDTSNEGGLVRGKSALQQVLEAVADLERKKVITGPADSVGVMLWNVDVSTNILETCCTEFSLPKSNRSSMVITNLEPWSISRCER